MSKLYLIVHNEEIEYPIAICEYKKRILEFYQLMNYSSDEYSIIVIRDSLLIKKYLIQYSELYVDELYEFTVLIKDIPILEEMIYGMLSSIYSAMNILEGVRENCLLSFKEIQSIDETIGIIKSQYTKKNIMNFINIGKVISDYYQIDNLDTIRSLSQRYKEMIS